MYNTFYRFSAEPFRNSPDPDFLLLLPQTREALAGLQYGIRSRKGFMVLTGEVGTGKTTLLQQILATSDRSREQFSFVFNPRLELLDFLEFILADFGLVPAARTKSAMLQQLNRWLIEQYRQGKTCVVLIDEAHHLSWELLEEIRLLTNLETRADKLLQIVLSAQPELEEMMAQSNARQIRQRIALWCRTLPFDLQQTELYIEFRIRKVLLPSAPPGGEPIFSPESVAAIYEASEGIPRLINLLCDHCLILGFVDDRRTITPDIVRSVLRDNEVQTAPRQPQHRASGANGFDGMDTP